MSGQLAALLPITLGNQQVSQKQFFYKACRDGPQLSSHHNISDSLVAQPPDSYVKVGSLGTLVAWAAVPSLGLH
jgi:hypothetical protein